MASLSRLARSPISSKIPGPAPFGASRGGPPAPCRLEQPSPGTSPISDVSRRRNGHRLAGSSTDGKLARRTPRDARRSVDPASRDRLPAAPCVAVARTIETPSVVSRSAGLPAAAERRCLSWWRAERNSRTLSPQGPAACVSTSCGVLYGQCRDVYFPCGSSNVRARRCAGPTSAFSRFRTSTRASSVPGASRANAPARSGRSPVSRQCDSLRRAARTSWVSPLRALSSRGGACVPCLWHPCRLPRDDHRARADAPS
jgi:hypothetical protein